MGGGWSAQTLLECCERAGGLDCQASGGDGAPVVPAMRSGLPGVVKAGTTNLEAELVEA